MLITFDTSRLGWPAPRRTALAIRNSHSASCVPRLRQREVPLDPDAAIIAEALATGYDLLMTTNMRSIDHVSASVGMGTGMTVTLKSSKLQSWSDSSV